MICALYAFFSKKKIRFKHCIPESRDGKPLLYQDMEYSRWRDKPGAGNGGKARRETAEEI